MAPVRSILYARSHDYGHLVRRWRRAARRAGLRLEPFASASGYELFGAETRRPDPAAPWLYLSAGIHGDEPATTEALLEWTGTSPWATRVNLLVFPCLNPWGLVNNMRLDENGRDLNRCYHRDDVPVVTAHRALMARHRYAAALMLHEDYDATGLYLYEVREQRPFWGESLLAAGARHLPIERRASIEGRRSRHGIVRRKVDPAGFPTHPEAFALHLHYSARTFTTETPSEACLDDRVAAHVAMVERAAQLCCFQPPRARGTNAPLSPTRKRP